MKDRTTWLASLLAICVLGAAPEVAAEPRLNDDRDTLILLDEIRTPAARRQPKITLTMNRTTGGRQVHVAGRGIVPQQRIAAVCGGRSWMMGLSESRRTPELSVATYDVPRDVVARVLNWPHCSLVIAGAKIPIPRQLASLVWSPGSRGGATREKAVSGKASEDTAATRRGALAEPKSSREPRVDPGMEAFEQGRYAEAETKLRAALKEAERRGAHDPSVATVLNNLGEVYLEQVNVREAESALQRALIIGEQTLGPEHLTVGATLERLAKVRLGQQKIQEAETMAKRSLAIREKALGTDHLDVARSVATVAAVHFAQGQYGQAESLHRRALAIRERVLGAEHPHVARSVNALAEVHLARGQYAEAEPLYRRALAIREKALGPEHPAVGATLQSFARYHFDQRQYDQAESFVRRALAINEKALGPESLKVGAIVIYLAQIYEAQGQLAKAELSYRRALAIQEKTLGPDHYTVGRTLNILAGVYYTQKQYAQAEPLVRRALAIYEKALGPTHWKVAEVRQNYASLLRRTGRAAEAEELEAGVNAIQRRSARPEASDTAVRQAGAERRAPDTNEDLREAARAGETAKVTKLLREGADPNAKDQAGGTALTIAANQGRIHTVKALIRGGAEVNANSPGGFVGWVLSDLPHPPGSPGSASAYALAENRPGTALMAAALAGHTEVVRVLIDAKADVNAQNANAHTALMIAAVRGDAEMVEVLIRAGANVNGKNSKGKTALMEAEAMNRAGWRTSKSDYTKVVELLRRAGGG